MPPVLRRYKKPKLPINLDQGYGASKPDDYNGATSNLQNVLDTLKEHNIDTKGAIVTFRNNMNKILCSPYAKDSWEIDVHREGDTMFLGVRILESPTNSYQERASYWGRRFEVECSERLDPDDVEFCSIVKTRLNQKRLILAAEIDCFEEGSSSRKQTEEESESTKKIGKFEERIELKTYSIVTPKNDYNFRRKKLLHFFVQSFMAGVPRIICGFRNENGVVQILDTIRTLDIPKMAGDAWDYGVCLQFADQLLDTLWKEVMEGQKYVLKFYPPYENVYMHKYVT